MFRYITLATVFATAAFLTGCQDSFMGPEMMDEVAVLNAAEADGTTWPAVLKYEVRDNDNARANRSAVAGIQSLSVRIQHSGPNVRLLINNSDRANFRLNANHNTLRGTGFISVGDATFDLSQIDSQNISQMPREFDLVGTTSQGATVVASLAW